MKKSLAIVAIVVGLALVALAIVYWSVPANALPSYLPGADPSLAAVHFKHGLASLILGLAAFAYAWFSSGPKQKDSQA